MAVRERFFILFDDDLGVCGGLSRLLDGQLDGDDAWDLFALDLVLFMGEVAAARLGGVAAARLSGVMVVLLDFLVLMLVPLLFVWWLPECFCVRFLLGSCSLRLVAVSLSLCCFRSLSPLSLLLLCLSFPAGSGAEFSGGSRPSLTFVIACSPL